MKKLWFVTKRYGWGWTPATWEGWLVLVVFVAVMVANAMRLGVADQSPMAPAFPTEFVVETAILVALLISICYAKGEKPRWRWGK